MIERNPNTALAIYETANTIPDPQNAFRHGSMVQMSAASRLRIRNAEPARCRLDFTGITYLTARLRVERSPVEYNDSLLARFEDVYFRTRSFIIYAEQPGNAAVRVNVVIPSELGIGLDAYRVSVLDREPTRSTRPGALALHLGFETGFVHPQITLSGNVSRKVERKAIGVIEAKEHRARDGAAVKVCDFLLEHAHACGKRPRELLFFQGDHSLYVCALTCEFWIGITHFSHKGRYEAVEEGIRASQLVSVTKRSPNDPAQYVASALVARKNTVDDEKTR